MDTTIDPLVSIKNVSKRYGLEIEALRPTYLDIYPGEILALLGPNGAGKTTLISIICGLVRASSGTVIVDNFDIVRHYRKTRALIGLVPQELTVDSFSPVLSALALTRGLFGLKPDPEFLDQLLEDLSLTDKRNTPIMALSGGMKRRLLIAKALSHQPKILFLDEPTAGVDVTLRADMWEMVRKLRASGVTIILTTHYIEEAEAVADRIGVMDRGKIILLEPKTTLMKKFGKKSLILRLNEPLQHIIPAELETKHGLTRSEDGAQLIYQFGSTGERTGITALLSDLAAAGIRFNDLETRQTTLQDIFIDIVGIKT